MKFEWQECTIGDLGQIVTGKTPPTKNNEYWGGKVMFITPKDIQATKHIFKTERYVTGEGKVSVRGAILPKGSICVSCIGNIGYLGITTEECISNQQINSIIVNENNDIDFVYYLLKSLWAYFKNYEGQSTALSILNKTQFSKIKVQIPNIEVQKKIAGVLKMLDEKIELNTAINKNLEQQAQALFKAWFVDFIPFNGAKPYNWTISSLGEVTNMGAGGDKPKIISEIQTEECPYPIYSNGLSENGLYGYTNTPKICDESVTVSARGTIGFVCIRHTPYVPIVRLVTLIPNTEIISAKYLYLYLKQLSITGTGTTQQQLTVPDFRKTEILVPDKESMSAFTDIITPLFSKIWTNEKENASLSATRDLLLPKLMSGELDVADIEL